MHLNRDALVEATKEGLRVVLLAVLPVAISQLEVGHLDWRVLITVATVAVLRGVDKYLHKAVNVGGLTRF
jgi:hypothetical protein